MQCGSTGYVEGYLPAFWSIGSGETTARISVPPSYYGIIFYTHTSNCGTIAFCSNSLGYITSEVFEATIGAEGAAWFPCQIGAPNEYKIDWVSAYCV